MVPAWARRRGRRRAARLRGRRRPRRRRRQRVLDGGRGADTLDPLRLGADVMPVATGSDLAQLVHLVEQDVTGDGTFDTAIRLDYVDPASGVHYTDPGSGITLAA